MGLHSNLGQHNAGTAKKETRSRAQGPFVANHYYESILVWSHRQLKKTVLKVQESSPKRDKDLVHNSSEKVKGL